MESKSKWITMSSRIVFSRPPYVRVYQEEVCINSCKIVDDYYRVILPRFAACVPYTEDGRVITLWQYKHGPRAYTLTFPAGFIEENEIPSDACSRELLEETGYRPTELLLLGSYVDGGNQEGSTGFYFKALGCKKVQEPNSDDLEESHLRIMTEYEIKKAIYEGAITISHHALIWFLAANA